MFVRGREHSNSPARKLIELWVDWQSSIHDIGLKILLLILQDGRTGETLEVS
jgi:hypothetical protein